MFPTLLDLAKRLERPDGGILRLTGLSWYAGDGSGPRREPLGLREGRFLQDPPGSAPSFDLSGLTLLPGLTDAHLHLFGQAQRRMRVDLSGISRREELWVRLDGGPKTGPLLAWGWDESEWDEPRFPERRELETRYPGREVMLVRVCGHVVVASGPAMESLDEIPKNGDPRRGILLEDGADALRRRYPQPPERIVEAARDLASELAAEGLTAVTEMGAGQLPEAMALLEEDFPLRVECYHSPVPGDARPFPKSPESPHRVLGGKFFLDGSIGGRSAALEFEYREGGNGQLLWEAEALVARLAALFGEGRRAALHAIGSRAVDQALHALDRADAPPGRARIEHLETARPDQLARMAARGWGAGFQPNFMDRWGRPGGLYEQRLGGGYRRFFPGPGDFRRAGLKPVYGTDGMPCDLWGALRAAADEELFGEAADAPGRILAAVTGDAARETGMEKERGRVAEGLSADFALFDFDPVAGSFRKKRPSLLTVLAGRITRSPQKGESPA